MLNPLLFMVLDRWQLREDARVLANTPPEPDVVPLDIGGHAIVVGYGRVGSQLAQVLQERGVPVVVIDDDRDRVEQARALLPAIVRQRRQPAGDAGSGARARQPGDLRDAAGAGGRRSDRAAEGDQSR